MQEQLLDHEDRIKTLEKNYAVLVGDMAEIRNGQLRLENTILKTTQDQNQLLNKLIDNSFDLKKTSVVSKKEIWVAILGGGGALGVIGALLSKFL